MSLSYTNIPSNEKSSKLGEGRSVFLLIALAVITACTSGPASQTIEWDRNPEARIVRIHSPYTTAGLAGAYDDRYYIPEVQIWGDGRILWIAKGGTDRQIHEDQLTDEQVERLLRRIANAGFFEWEASYQTLGGNSAPAMVLEVNLADRTKAVSEHGGAPEAYYDLVAYLQQGAGAQGQPFVPDEGYLTLQRFSADVEGKPWPAGSSLSPKDVGDGIYIQGALLNFAWDEINKNPTGPTYVTYEGETYHMMVQIPELSCTEPPAPDHP